MKTVCILKGSTRKNGNTNALTECFSKTLKEKGCRVTELDLSQMEIRPCIACRSCQRDKTVLGCRHNDDLRKIFDAVMKSDITVLSSPIYSWYCTPIMKSVLDRLVYGMNKYYGEEPKLSLWAGKHMALITTCGYGPEKGADLWEEGVKRYCKHSRLKYEGMLVERHLGYDTVFMDEKKEKNAAAFAEKLINSI